MEDHQIRMLVEAFMEMKQKQMSLEEQLIELFKPPLYKKWMHERVTNQYKHQRMLRDIVGEYTEELSSPPVFEKGDQAPEAKKTRIEDLLEDIEQNIENLSMIMGTLDEFSTYKKFQEILKDEQVHQNRLMRMLYRRVQ